MRTAIFVLAALLTFSGCKRNADPSAGLALGDPAEVIVGERLFKETRFSQFFAAHAMDVNEPLAGGDPVMDVTETLTGNLPGPFAGQAMNCSACHLVDQQDGRVGGGIRTYGDFARRSPIPAREDGKSVTPRNSPPLVNATLTRNVPLLLHFDGEFPSIADLVKGTLKGRNFGWLPAEKDQAVGQVARVLREDDGSDALAAEFGGWSYKDLLKGEDPKISPAFRLPEGFRIDVTRANDQELLDAVAKLIGAYVDGLRFGKDANGEYKASPYDVFLAKNGLPRKPVEGESEADYSLRLLGAVEALSEPQFLTHSDGQFDRHPQQFLFGEKELRGLKAFFGKGNCLACHAAPDFTDFRFHNTGVTQREFDSLHGDGSFAVLEIPDLAARRANPDSLGKFLAVPSVENPEDTDLGVWNVFANDDIPDPQTGLKDLICREFQSQAPSCADEALLPLTIAYFKTPSLRDLGHSAPFMHNGQFDDLASVVEHYRLFSEKAREGDVRNPSFELLGIRLNPEDTEDLVAFLKALNEDYE